MKKISLAVLISFSAAGAIAQSLDDVKKYAFLNKGAEAKIEVDKYLAVEKNAKKPEGWFYKGFIYNMISKEPALAHDSAVMHKKTAFEAIKKYREMDPKAPLLEENNNSTLFDLYVGYASELGIKSYNEKNPAQAHEDFKNGLEIHQYIFSNNLTGANGYKFTALDTILVLYAGATAIEAKKPEAAMPFYQKLADAEVAGDNYLDVYQMLADHYKTKKDKAAFDGILTKGRKLFPKNEEYWMALEIEDATDGIKRPEIFAKYEALEAKYPTNYTIAYNHAVELYQYIYSEEMKNQNTSEFKSKLREAGKNAIAKKSTIESNFLLANFLYSNSIDVSDEARKRKGPKPEDLKRRKAIEADANKEMESAIPYADAVVAIFEGMSKTKNSEKINYKQSLTILKNIYEVKKDAAKVAALEKKIAAAE
jgi:hypothetical protein